MNELDEDVDAVLRLHSLWQHQGAEHINVIRWSHDDLFIAVAFADGSLSVFDSETGHCRWRREAHGLATSALEWSPDAHFIASGGQRGGLRVWDGIGGELILELESGSGWVEHLSWAPSGLLACASGKVITLWSGDGNLVQTLDPSPSTVTGLRWLSDGRLCSSSYGMVNLWAVTQSAPENFFPWKDSLLGVAISPDERFIAAACQDSAVHLWYAATGEGLHMGGYPSKIKSMDWSQDSKYLATASGQMVVVWNCDGEGPAGREPKVIPVHQKAVSTISFDHSSHRLASAGQDGLVLVYDIARDDPVAGLFNEDPVTALAWSNSGQRIAVGDDQGCLQVCLLPQ